MDVGYEMPSRKIACLGCTFGLYLKLWRSGNLKRSKNVIPHCHLTIVLICFLALCWRTQNWKTIELMISTSTNKYAWYTWRKESKCLYGRHKASTRIFLPFPCALCCWHIKRCYFLSSGLVSFLTWLWPTLTYNLQQRRVGEALSKKNVFGHLVQKNFLQFLFFKNKVIYRFARTCRLRVSGEGV